MIHGIEDDDVGERYIVACRPVDPRDYPRDRLRMWNEVSAEIGEELPIYDGSIVKPCWACKVSVYLGPKQQAAIQLWDSEGTQHALLCLICAALALHEDPPDDVDVLYVEDLIGPELT